MPLLPPKIIIESSRYRHAAWKSRHGGVGAVGCPLGGAGFAVQGTRLQTCVCKKLSCRRDDFVIPTTGEFYRLSCEKLQGLVTDRLTALWSDRTNLPEAEGAPIFKSEIRSKWAFTALRSNAQVRLDAARAIMLGKVGVADEDG